MDKSTPNKEQINKTTKQPELPKETNQPNFKQSLSAINSNKIDFLFGGVKPDFIDKPIFVHEEEKKTVKSLHVEDSKKSFDNLQGVADLLGKIFKDEEITIEDFQLSSPEMHILVELLLRKNKGRTNLK